MDLQISSITCLYCIGVTDRDNPNKVIQILASQIEWSPFRSNTKIQPAGPGAAWPSGRSGVFPLGRPAGGPAHNYRASQIDRLKGMQLKPKVTETESDEK